MPAPHATPLAPSRVRSWHAHRVVSSCTAVLAASVCTGECIRASAKQRRKYASRSALATAKAGDKHAQFDIGVCYEAGHGIAKDAILAVKWYRRCSRGRPLSCSVQFGRPVTLMGAGVAADAKQAVLWYRRAAEAGDDKARYNLAYYYAMGDGVAKDTKQAVFWLRRAAHAGNADAQCQLGFCYAEGNGVSKDSEQAASWCRRSARQVTQVLSTSWATVTPMASEFPRIACWQRCGMAVQLRRADTDAQFNLGYCYAEGDGRQGSRVGSVVVPHARLSAGHAKARVRLGKSLR